MPLKGAQTETVAALLSGPPESSVELELVSSNGTTRVITLTRMALCINSVSWARAVLPLRARRLKLEESLEVLSDADCRERDELIAGEACYLRIRGKLASAGFGTFDSIPRRGKSKTNLKFACPKVRGISENDVLLLTAWLAHLRPLHGHMASLKMLQVKPTCLPSMEMVARRSTKKTIESNRLKTQNLTRQSEKVRSDGPLHRAFKLEIDRIKANGDLLWANWRTDGVPLQDHSLALLMANALNRAVILGDELAPYDGRGSRGDDTALRSSEVAAMAALHKIGDEIETAAFEISRAADAKATRLPGMLRRLLKKCSRDPEAKDHHRLWWEDRMVHRPPVLQKALEGSQMAISKSIRDCWEKDDWLSHLGQACRNALIYEHSDVKIPAPRYKKPRAPDTAHVSIEEVGRNLIKRVDGVRTLIPPGFTRLAPRMETNQTLAELADLLGTQSCPVDQEDAISVERDVIHILRLTGPTVALKRLKSGHAGRGLISPLEVFEAAFNDWSMNLRRFVKPALVAPAESWQAKFDSSQVNLSGTADGVAKDLGLQVIQKREAWISLVRRRELKPASTEDRYWQDDSKNWKFLMQAADLLRPSAFSWTVYAPPTLQEGVGQKPCTSLEEVRKWSEAYERDGQQSWKQGNGGLEFKCQLNTPTLDRLRQLESLCNAGQAAQLRQTLIDHQDLIRLRERGYARNGLHTSRGGWWVRAVAEEEAAKCNGCDQTWSVRELGRGCPSCRPQTVGKRGKPKRPKNSTTTGTQDAVEEADDQAMALTPQALVEAQDPMTMEPQPEGPETPVQTIRASTRDKEASKRRYNELVLSCRSTKISKAKVMQQQVSRGLLMRSALPEELTARAEGADFRDTVYTVPLLRECITNMIHDMEKDIDLPIKGADRSTSCEPPWKWFTSSDLGFPLLDDIYDRPIHPLVETYARECLQYPEMMDGNEEAGEHGEGAEHSLMDLLQNMITDWGHQDGSPQEADPKALTTNRERYSVPYAARNPDIIQDYELDDENTTAMVLNPPNKGVVRFLTEPGCLDTSRGGISASTHQGVATLITPRGPYAVEGARWHLLSKIFSSDENFKNDVETEITAQEALDAAKGYRSFSWQFLRQAQEIFDAKTYCGDTALTAPPFFDNAQRGETCIWGTKEEGPRVVNWTGLGEEDRATLRPQLESTSGWIILALSTGTKQIPPVQGAKQLLIATGKTYRQKGWWKSGQDKLVAYDKEVVVWISDKDSVRTAHAEKLKSLLESKSGKDQPAQCSKGHEDTYWAGTEAGLLSIPDFKGIIYATDGSLSAEGMGAGFYRHDTRSGGCCRVGNSDEGGSSNRSEHAAAALALENSLIAEADRDKGIVILTDSKCLLDSIQPWIGEGCNPMIHKFPDGDILRVIIELLRKRVDRGLFTLFVKIRAHRGEFFNEMSDRWADKGALATDNVRWNCPRLKPIFSWKVGEKLHRGVMSKSVKARVNLMAAKLELPKHNGRVATFLKMQDHGREILGMHWTDKNAPIKAKRRLLQSISMQFPCAATFKLWGMQDNDECRLCKRLHPERIAFSECLGHIQSQCLSLQRPRIAVHHGIWRELHKAISRWSTEKNSKDDDLKWVFPSAVSDSDHDEWSFRRTVVHLGLVDWSNSADRKAFRQDVAEYHLNLGLWEEADDDNYEAKIDSFLAARPDGIAFNAEDRICVFLEFTRPMDTRRGSPEEPGDWAEEKDFTKNLRYENHRNFLETYSNRKLGRLRWTCTQMNFTIGARGSIKTEDFDARLAGLGIPDKSVRRAIAVRTVRKTLELSDAMLSIFHLSIRTNPEWAKHAVSDTLVNTSTVRYNLFKTFTGPTSGFGI